VTDCLNRRDFFAAGVAVTAAASLAPTALAGVKRAAPPAAATPPLIRLSANENPYGPGPLARAAITASADQACRYPMALASQLAEKLAGLHGVDKNRVVLGAGSGELLNTLALAYCERAEVVCAWPTFEQLISYAEKRGADVHRIPLDARMRHDLPALAAAVTPNTALIYLCNPNNPTGTAIPGAALRPFCEAMARQTLVVVDEAYFDLIEPGATESLVDLVRADCNVAILRTFSKIHGLAGLRVGYCVAPPAVAARLRKLLAGTMPNVAGLSAALASLDDTAFLATTRGRILADRARIQKACDELGLPYADAQGNFVFINVGMPVDTFRARLHAMNIEVGRPFEPYKEWCRVTVGTKPETDALLAALPAALKG
jgi:histidinol-phosphate aminotransferase